MLVILIKHELRQLAAERTLYLMVLLLIIVVGFGLWNGQRWVDFQRQAITAAQQEQVTALVRAKAQAERVRAGTEQVSWWASAADVRGFVWQHLVSYAYQPPAALAVLAVGQSDLYPYLVKVSTQPLSNLIATYEHVNVRKLLLGSFDLAFVVIYLLPLLILALCYDLLVSEKEQGILGLLAAQPVSLVRLALLKVGIRLILVLTIVAVALLAALSMSGFVFTAPRIELLLLWLGVMATYSLFWFLLGMFIIAQGWESTTNALALTGLWLLLVVLVPAGVGFCTTLAYPVPSRVHYINTVRDVSTAITRDKNRIAERFFVEHPQLRPLTREGEKQAGIHLSWLERDRQEQDFEAEFTRQLGRQQNLVERLKFFSPALLVHSAFLELTGTGLTRHRHFQAQVRHYHTTLKNYFSLKRIKGDYAFNGFDEFPRFHAQESEQEILGTGFEAIVALSFEALVLAMLALPRLRRYTLF